jgi:hypothetical protein
VTSLEANQRRRQSHTTEHRHIRERLGHRLPAPIATGPKRPPGPTQNHVSATWTAGNKGQPRRTSTVKELR